MFTEGRMLALYFAAWIATYGYAFQYFKDADTMDRFFSSFVLSLLWPLYWSIQIWK